MKKRIQNQPAASFVDSYSVGLIDLPARGGVPRSGDSLLMKTTRDHDFHTAVPTGSFSCLFGVPTTHV